MFWIPVLIIAAVVAAIVGTAAALGVFEPAKGKRLVLLGPKGTGKTTWATYLSTGVIPAGYTHTSVTITTEDVKLEDLGLKVSIVDNSGSEAALNDWHNEAKKADHIYYFVDACRLSSERHMARILKDAGVMSMWTDVTAPLTLMLTHADKIPAGASGDYDKIKTQPRTVDIRQRLGASHVVVGEQQSEQGRLDFTVEALLPLSKKESS